MQTSGGNIGGTNGPTYKLQLFAKWQDLQLENLRLEVLKSRVAGVPDYVVLTGRLLANTGEIADLRLFHRHLATEDDLAFVGEGKALADAVIRWGTFTDPNTGEVTIAGDPKWVSAILADGSEWTLHGPVREVRGK